MVVERGLMGIDGADEEGRHANHIRAKSKPLLQNSLDRPCHDELYFDLHAPPSPSPFTSQLHLSDPTFLAFTDDAAQLSGQSSTIFFGLQALLSQ